MIQLNDALAEQFPARDEWVRDALSSLGDSLKPTSPVHAVMSGWLQRPTSEAVDLIDTLFVLTPDRLGLGHTDPNEALHWIPMDAIQNLDAIDDSPLPLQTIEVFLIDGSTITVGWIESFSEQVVSVLVALLAGQPQAASESQPAPATPATSDADAWIDDPSEPPTAPTSALSAEPSGGTDPSAWFSVGENIDDPPLSPAAFTANEDLPAFLRAELIKVNEERKTVPSLADLPAPPVAARGVAPSEAPPVFGEPSHYNPATQYADSGLEPTNTWSFDDVVEPDVPGPSGDPDVASGSGAGSAMGSEHGEPPWLAPGMMWPEPMRGVLYLGGHPAHSRKRKNGTMVFSPNGIDVGGAGLQNWSMSMEWAYVEGVEIQGPDEVMFADHLKIDSASSALIVTMIDGTRMFFEVRTRRPPSLRSSLAPVLSMVESLGSHRVSH